MAGPIADLGGLVSDKAQVQGRGEKRLMTVREASQYLGLAEATLYRYVWQRTIRFVRLGRAVRFDKSDLDALIECHKVEPRDDQFDIDFSKES